MRKTILKSNFSFDTLRNVNAKNLPVDSRACMKAILAGCDNISRLIVQSDNSRLSQTEFSSRMSIELAEIQIKIDSMATLSNVNLGLATLSKFFKLSKKVY